MARFTRKCIVCKSEYEFCPNCSDFDNKPRWMTLFCSDNCHDIFQVASDYENKILTKEQAKAKLEKLDLSKRKNFTDSLKHSVDEIMGNKVVEDPKPVEEPKVEAAKEEPKKEEAKAEAKPAEKHDAIPASVQRSISNFNNNMKRNNFKK